VTGSTTGGVGTFDEARGAGCAEFCLELCFKAWLLDLVIRLRSAATRRLLRFATGLTPLDRMASSNATLYGAGWGTTHTRNCCSNWLTGSCNSKALWATWVKIGAIFLWHITAEISAADYGGGSIARGSGGAVRMLTSLSESIEYPLSTANAKAARCALIIRPERANVRYSTSWILIRRLALATMSFYHSSWVAVMKSRIEAFASWNLIVTTLTM